MTRGDRMQNSISMKLYPHQAALLETFFSPTCKHLLLKGGYGTGKTATLNAIAKRLLELKPSARILFIGSEQLIHTLGEKLCETNTPSKVIERYRYRELLDQKATGDLWPKGQVNFISDDFANNRDISISISEFLWDLVIIDEASFYKFDIISLFDKFDAAADKIIISSILTSENNDIYVNKGIEVVEWRPEEFTKYPQSILEVPRPALHEVVYKFTPLERKIRHKLETLLKKLKPNSSLNFLSDSMRDSIQSSPAALERILQKIVEGTNNPVELTYNYDLTGTDLPKRTTIFTNISDAVKVQEIAAKLIEDNNNIDSDSKLEAFNRLISCMREDSYLNCRICVITKFISTLYYLAAEVEAHGIKCKLLHAGMALPDRQRSISDFNKDGGILISTIAPLQGFELSDATDLVLYDIPSNKEALWIVLSRFDRIGRSTKLNMHVLLPDNGAESVTTQSLSLLYEILRESYNGRSGIARLGDL